jgi:hypothetical protein
MNMTKCQILRKKPQDTEKDKKSTFFLRPFLGASPPAAGPGFPLQFLGIAPQFLRYFRFYPLRAKPLRRLILIPSGRRRFHRRQAPKYIFQASFFCSCLK